MSVAAVMLVKDEADIVEATVRHLLRNVDEVVVADNLSTDGTWDVLSTVAGEDDRLEIRTDEEVGYYQAQKTTRLALEMLGRGHRWVIPCDADELWFAPEGRSLRDWLAAIGRETQFVKAAIFNHVATALDAPERCSCDHGTDPATLSTCNACEGTGGEPDPVRRLRWKTRVPLDRRWGKIACRLRPDLEIHQGNHSAATSGVGASVDGLEIRHFPYRSAEHFVRKAINGYAAYQATDLDESIGRHWRHYGQAIAEGGVEAGYAWFRDAFWSPDPYADDSLVEDPAPVAP